MTVRRVGMDPAAMRGYADEFERAAHEISGLVWRINSGVSHNVVEWLGQVAVDWTNAWSLRSKARLLQVEFELRRLADTLRREIAQQEQASAASGTSFPLALRVGESATYDNGKLRITAGQTFRGTGPRSVSDLLDPLHNDDKLGHSADPRSVYHYPGGISVAILGEPPDRHVIVTVAGVQRFGVGEANQNDNLTNIANFLGMHSGREDAIAEALVRSGVTHDDPIMLVGHSQGGASSIAFAHDYAKDPRFHVESIVTIGAPDAPKNPPSDVDVLELRGWNDAVPGLGYDILGPGSNVHRVVVPESPFSSVLTAHDPAYYQSQLPNDPQIAAFENHHPGFFRGEPSSTSMYANERVR